MMSCFDTTWQKLPPHLSRKTAREREALPSSGEPKVMQRTCVGEGEDAAGRLQRSQRAQREAIAPPMQWPVIIIDLLFSISANICLHVI